MYLQTCMIKLKKLNQIIKNTIELSLLVNAVVPKLL